MPRYGHGSNFVALTATLEVKLSSRTLEDIIIEESTFGSRSTARRHWGEGETKSSMPAIKSRNDRGNALCTWCNEDSHPHSYF